MFDKFERRIDYLRISVTDLCNLRCSYCRPAEGVTLIPHEEILSYEEIVDFTRVAVDCGIRKVRLTGGEPLVRRDFVSLVQRLAQIHGLEDLSMTTNATLLEKFAAPLKEAGLQRINVSLDTLDARRFHEITRGGDLQQVLKGIEAAKAAGLFPIKLNCVVHKSADEQDAKDVAQYGREHGLEVRFIRQMNIAAGDFWVVEGGSGGRCGACNRLRLASDGNLRPCLFNDIAFNIRELDYREAIRLAVAAKPEKGDHSLSNQMHAIGG